MENPGAAAGTFSVVKAIRNGELNRVSHDWMSECQHASADERGGQRKMV